MTDTRLWGRNARTTDLVLAMFTFVALAIPMVVNHPGRDDRPVDALAWLLPVVLAGAMLLRRRWPVAVLVASSATLLGYYALKYPPVGLELPLAGAFYTVAEAGRLRWGVGIGAVLQCFAFGVRLLQGQDGGVLVGFEIPSALAINAAALALGDAARQRRRQRLDRDRAEAAASLEHEREAQRRVEQERVHLARELHDVLAHTVSVIGIQAGVAAEAIEDEDRTAATRSVAAIRRTSGEAMRDLRTTLGILRGEDNCRAPVGSLVHIDALADTTREAGIEVRLEVSSDLAADLADGRADLPTAIDATAYRVVQESLTNVLRHSGAALAVVRLQRRNGHLDVLVTDDGRGPAPDPGPEKPTSGSGHGIRGMTERVVLVGGELETGASPSGGFQVRARLPL